MLKRQKFCHIFQQKIQPPSGGCVLKLVYQPCAGTSIYPNPAAFGRLCVETNNQARFWINNEPAAFGRLCVETAAGERLSGYGDAQPPSGGCVLKPWMVY